MEILFGRPSVKKHCDVRHAKIILTSVVDIHDGKMLKDVRHEKNILTSVMEKLSARPSLTNYTDICHKSIIIWTSVMENCVDVRRGKN